MMMSANLVWRRLAVSLALALLLLFAGAGLLTGAHATWEAPDASHGSGKLIVAVRQNGLNEAQVEAILVRHGARLDRWLPELGLARTIVAPGAEQALPWLHWGPNGTSGLLLRSAGPRS